MHRTCSTRRRLLRFPSLVPHPLFWSLSSVVRSSPVPCPALLCAAALGTVLYSIAQYLPSVARLGLSHHPRLALPSSFSTTFARSLSTTHCSVLLSTAYSQCTPPHPHTSPSHHPRAEHSRWKQYNPYIPSLGTFGRPIHELNDCASVTAHFPIRMLN